MGTILRGLCKCGFDTGDIFVGAGFANFMDTCNAPAICLHCSEFLVRNYMKKDTALCPGCDGKLTFYDDPSLWDPSAKIEKHGYLFTWRIADRDEFFKLPDAKFLCPTCKSITLVFEDIGRWD
jgi:Zn finger protein HypA/HybF involved in hydrogenase expression